MSTRTHEDVLQGVVGKVLFLPHNWPDNLQRQVLGRDFSKLRDALVEALVPLFEGVEEAAFERGFDAGYAEARNWDDEY